MNRYTQTDKWDDPWFRKLTPGQKLVFIFLIENCNNAGFYEEDQEHMAYLIGMDQERTEGALKGLERGITRASGWTWVHNFLRHQKNEELNPSNPAHKQIITLISVQRERFAASERFQSFLEKYQGLIRGFEGASNAPIIGKGTVLSKEEVQEKPKRSKATVNEVMEFCVSEKLPSSDADWFFHKCEGNGWINGGKPIKDWKATIRSWRAAGYLPSQKNGTGVYERQDPAMRL